MSRYLVAPYLFQIKARGIHGSPAMPIDNIDGKNTSLQAATGEILSALLTKQEFFDHLDGNKQYEIRDLQNYAGKAFLLTVAPGRRGLESDIVTPTGQKTARTAKDAEFIPLRHLVFFPDNSYSAIIFAERFGRYGVLTFLRTCMYQTMVERFAALTTRIDPLTHLAALTQASYKKIAFKTPAKGDASGKLMDFGNSIDIELTVKHPRKVQDLITQDGKLSRHKVFGVLRDESSSSGLKPPPVKAGWDVSLTVELKNGQTRTFDLDDDGPALVYPLSGAVLSNGTLVPSSTRPSDDDFLSVCNEILSDVEGQYGITSSSRVGDSSIFKSWKSSNPNPWKVRYHDGP